MADSINLRGDLAKLDDAELAARLEAAWTTVDAFRERSGWLSRMPLASFRGPVRHPRAYRFLRLLELAEGGPVGLLAAWLLSSKRITGALMDASPEMTLCEIRDINDEIERRIRMRGAASQPGD